MNMSLKCSECPHPLTTFFSIILTYSLPPSSPGYSPSAALCCTPNIHVCLTYYYPVTGWKSLNIANASTSKALESNENASNASVAVNSLNPITFHALIFCQKLKNSRLPAVTNKHGGKRHRNHVDMKGLGESGSHVLHLHPPCPVQGVRGVQGP